MTESNSPKPKESNNEQTIMRANFFASWMSRLGAAFRQEINLQTQAMYLQGLADLPLDRLELAFERAVRECRFVPTIAELREFEATAEVPKERIEAAYERRKQQILAAPEVKALPSVLDEKKPSKRPLKLLTEAEHNERVKFLRGQVKP